jgi:hypothetical protein
MQSCVNLEVLLTFVFLSDLHAAAASCYHRMALLRTVGVRVVRRGCRICQLVGSSCMLYSQTLFVAIMNVD